MPLEANYFLSLHYISNHGYTGREHGMAGVDSISQLNFLLATNFFEFNNFSSSANSQDV